MKERRIVFIGLNADAAQPRPRYGIYAERRNLFGLDQRLKGNWSFRCDEIENSDGLTEADITWASVNKLHEKEAGVLTLRLKKGFSVEGFTFINCYTPDYRDEKFILKVANLLRKHVYYPYVMYYYSSNGNVRYLHTPNGEFYGKEGNRWVLLDIE